MALTLAGLFDEARIWKEQTDNPYFTPLFNMPWYSLGFSGEIRTWAEQLQAVERAGWKLWQWSVGIDAKGRPQAMPVFVRAEDPRAAPPS